MSLPSELEVPKKNSLLNIFGLCERTLNSANFSTYCPSTAVPKRSVGPGSFVIVKQDGGHLECVCLAATQQVCLVEVVRVIGITDIPSRPASTEIVKPKPEFDPSSLSYSSQWPPDLPDGFPLTKTRDGYVARLSGKPKWICGKVSPRSAYAVYLKLKKNRLQKKRMQLIGSHVAFPWSDVFVPATAPKTVIAELTKREVSQWVYAPTAQAPDAIADIDGLKNFSESSSHGWCIYFLCLVGEVVYVGQSVNLRNRIKGHIESKKFDAVFYLPCRGESEACKLERRYIRKLFPTYNRSGNPEYVTKKRSGTPLSVIPALPHHLAIDSVLSPPPHTAPVGEGASHA